MATELNQKQLDRRAYVFLAILIGLFVVLGFVLIAQSNDAGATCGPRQGYLENRCSTTTTDSPTTTTSTSTTASTTTSPPSTSVPTDCPYECGPDFGPDLDKPESNPTTTTTIHPEIGTSATLEREPKLTG